MMSITSPVAQRATVDRRREHREEVVARLLATPREVLLEPLVDQTERSDGLLELGCARRRRDRALEHVGVEPPVGSRHSEHAAR
jgi:hypothetical protein